MDIVADLHIHGKYSRGTSKNITISKLEKYAKIKGINLLGTGDFTHPKWIKHLEKELPTENKGIYYTKNGFPFLFQTEISLVYTQGKKGRRVHHVVLAPSLEVAQQIKEFLETKGRTDYDGRPIFNLTSIEFVESLREISKNIEVIPAHVWTPWFGLLGSKSGFNSVEECFKEKAKHIHAIETGLSSDPPMNWRISKLDKYNLVSFSDLHSFWPWRIGREATVFEMDSPDYIKILKAIRTGKGLKKTIEVDPAYGKYHADGHRNCEIWMTPAEAKRYKGICPKCGKLLIIGVWDRIEELADRPKGFKPKNAVPYTKLIPLSDIIAMILGKGVATKNVAAEYQNLVTSTRPEMEILLKTPYSELKTMTTEKIAKTIMRNREGKIKIRPGYDGEYGKPLLEGEEMKHDLPKPKVEQKSIGDF